MSEIIHVASHFVAGVCKTMCGIMAPDKTKVVGYPEQATCKRCKKARS